MAWFVNERKNGWLPKPEIPKPEDVLLAKISALNRRRGAHGLIVGNN